MNLYKDKNWLYQQRVIERKSYEQIGQEFKFATKTIFDWCAKFNITKREKWEIINETHGKEICEKYSDDQTLLTDLAKQYCVTSYMIRKVVEFNGFDLKDIHMVAKEVNMRGRFKQRKHSINYDYFKTWSNNMAYILGFIYADGYITNSGLRINLQHRDMDFLQMISNELEYSGGINSYETTTNGVVCKVCYLDISSLDIGKDLDSIGLYPNKSLSIRLPEALPEEYEIDFVRGYFDGDGCIEVKRQIHNTKNSDTIQLRMRICSGSYGILDGIEKILRKNGLKQKNVNKCSGKRIMDICYSTNESYMIYDLFYASESMCMPRKKEKFELGFKLRNK